MFWVISQKLSDASEKKIKYFSNMFANVNEFSTFALPNFGTE